jgi:hypothetical protein
MDDLLLPVTLCRVDGPLLPCRHPCLALCLAYQPCLWCRSQQRTACSSCCCAGEYLVHLRAAHLQLLLPLLPRPPQEVAEGRP